MHPILQNLVSSAKRFDRLAVEQGIEQLFTEQIQLNENWYGVARLAIVVASFRTALRCLNSVPVNSDLKLQLNTVTALITCGALDEAQERLRIIDPRFEGNCRLKHLKGTLCAQMGNKEEAVMLLRQVVENEPEHGESWLTLSAMHSFANDETFASKLREAERVISAKATIDAKASYFSAVGKYYWDKQNYVQALASYSRCAELKKTTASAKDPYVHQAKSLVNDIKAIKRVLEAVPAAPEDTVTRPTPVFIVGLPRSGTTLLEQILAVNTNVKPLGEVNALEMAIKPFLQGRLISNAQDVSHILAEQVSTQVRNEYFRIVSERNGNKPYFTDKSLSNGRYLPLIQKIFPEAEVIWIKRNEIDTAWSIFRTYFSQGLGWSWSPDSIKQMIENEETLIRSWLENSPAELGVISYEEMVSKPEAVLPDLFSRLGLVYDENHLKFHASTHFVDTASVNQVRQSLNDEGIGASANVPEFTNAYQRLA
ncbi:tetratricopeptide repeat-containing sulfotransferase family protein [Alteromonas ponticola]|uniref:Sulfotransferase n=1 Tax=Alteromonas ponticola TaxID=2720613 RepID=A0ABX1QZ33_9ALTE|nr:sulfotransferase [Alteromonas ponticola]NMH58946.1 sulfotransferase [Alteromonas ponticola]